MIEHPTARKLLKAFRRFGRAEWHGRTVSGYKPSEIQLLFTINKSVSRDSPGMMVSEISKLLHVTSPTVTQLIKELEADGLIERNMDPADRRVVLIRLTEAGEQIAQKAAKAYSEALLGLIEYLGEEESNQLAELLGKVYVYFSEKQGHGMHESGWSGDDK